jgi:protein gp37
MGNARYRNGFKLTLHPDKLQEPLSWRSPRVVFVNSMSDLFHPEVPEEFIWSLIEVVEAAPQHTFQVLTKRPQRAMRVFDGYRLPANFWMGTSIENDRYVFRADYLRKIDVETRFLSCEPLIGPLPSLDLAGIGWVIVGGESGPNRRPVEVGWVRNIRDLSTREGVPFFFKQWGGHTAKAGGRELDGRTWDEMPGDVEVS